DEITPHNLFNSSVLAGLKDGRCAVSLQSSLQCWSDMIMRGAMNVALVAMPLYAHWRPPNLLNCCPNQDVVGRYGRLWGLSVVCIWANPDNGNCQYIGNTAQCTSF